MKRESKDIQRLLALKAHSQGRTFINDQDLQIEIPSPKEGSTAKNKEVFKNIYSHYMNAMGSGPGSTESIRQPTELQNEMEEAEHSFQSMMEMQKSIADAYKDLVK